MTLPNARLSTLVTLNCSVKPTALIASSAAVTRPKPTAETKTSTSATAGPRPIAGRAGHAHPDAALISAAVSSVRHRPIALRVALDGEALARSCATCRTPSARRRPRTGCACPARAPPCPRRRCGRRPRPRRRGHLRDEPVVDARLGRVGGVHGQRHDHDRVVVRDRVEVGVPLARLGHLLAGGVSAPV